MNAIEPGAVVEAEEKGREVRVALGGHEVLEENSFLQWRERIDILNVGRAAGSGRDDVIDLRLGEFDQRQHLRRDGCAPGGIRLAGAAICNDAEFGSRQRGRRW